MRASNNNKNTQPPPSLQALQVPIRETGGQCLMAMAIGTPSDLADFMSRVNLKAFGARNENNRSPSGDASDENVHSDTPPTPVISSPKRKSPDQCRERARSLKLGKQIDAAMNARKKTADFDHASALKAVAAGLEMSAETAGIYRRLFRKHREKVRNRNILFWLDAGLSNRQIAARLSLTTQRTGYLIKKVLSNQEGRK